MAFTDRSEGQMTQLVEQVASAIVEGWDSLDKMNQYQIKSTILNLLAACVDALDAEPFIPKRGDEIETWIKQCRDRSNRDSCDWLGVDELLDDYRLHADTGTPLSEPVETD